MFEKIWSLVYSSIDGISLCTDQPVILIEPDGQLKMRQSFTSLHQLGTIFATIKSHIQYAYAGK